MYFFLLYSLLVCHGSAVNLTLLSPGLGGDLRKLSQEYFNLTSGAVYVDVLDADYGTLNDELESISANGTMLSGRRVDLIYFGDTMVGSAVNKLDVLEPLTPYLEEMATRLGGRRIETEVVKGLEDDYRWGGVWYGLPLHFLVRLMIYRKDLYRWALGHDIAPRTFDEALANAREINKRLVANGSQPVDAFCVHTTQDYHDLLMLFPFYGSWGGTVLDNSLPPRCAMTSQRFRDSLTFFANLTWSGSSPPHSSEWDCTTRLLEGKTLHTITWPGLVNVCTFEPYLCPYARTMEETLNALGLAVPPSGGKGLQSRAYLGGEGFALLRSSKFKNESWQFLSWMMDPTGRPIRDLVTAAASLSANDVILDDLEFSGDSYIKRSQIKAKSFAASLNYPYSETGWMISEVERPGRLKDLIYNVVYKVKTVEAATAQFCELVNADIDKLWANMCPEGYVLDNSMATAPARRNCLKPTSGPNSNIYIRNSTFRTALGLSLLVISIALMYAISFVKLAMTLPPPGLAMSGLARSDLVAWLTMVSEFFQTLSLSLASGPQNQAIFKKLRENFFQYASLPRIPMPTSFWIGAVVSTLIIMASLPLAIIVIDADRQGSIQRRFPRLYRFFSRWLEIASLFAVLYIPVSSSLFFPVLQVLLRPFACSGDYEVIRSDASSAKTYARHADGLVCDLGAEHSTILAISYVTVLLYVVTFSATESFLQVSNPTRSVTFSPAAMLHITVAKVVPIFTSALFDRPVILLATQIVSTAYCAGISRTTDGNVRLSIISPVVSDQPISELAGLRYRSLLRQPSRPRVYMFSSSHLASRIRRSAFLSSTGWALAELALFFCISDQEASRARGGMSNEDNVVAIPLSIAALGFSVLLCMECVFSALDPSSPVWGGPVPFVCQVAGLVKARLTRTTSKARMMSLIPAPLEYRDIGAQADLRMEVQDEGVQAEELEDEEFRQEASSRHESSSWESD